MILDFPKKLLYTVLLLGSLQAQASLVSDPIDDYLPTYTGSTSGDLDVLKASVTYNPATDVFHLVSTFALNIGSTPTGFYILGFDRGAGTGRFAANGLPNVLFDSTVRFNNDGTGTVSLLTPGPTATTNLPAGTINILGNLITADIAGALLPSQGFSKSNYTWNLWPRDGSQTGFAAISDFAPNATNSSVQVVPLPASAWLLSSALGFLMLKRKQGKA